MTHVNYSRRTILTGIGGAFVFAAAASPAWAKTITRFSLKQGMALQGYDTTAYFGAGAATDGTDAHTVEWEGATWRFVTTQDAAAFRANPEEYAPQFGGYCTRAMSLGKEVPGDPEVWRIYKGKLYVFYAKVGGRHFDKGEDAMIALAGQHWDTLTFTE
jgi:hypothetical protein